MIYKEGDIVEVAQKQALSIEKLKQQAMKTGATPFYIECLEIEADDDIYISISSINEIRRAATDALQSAILKKSKRKALEFQKEKRKQMPIIKTKKLNVLVNTIEQFDIVSSDRRVHIIYCELTEDFKKNYSKYIEK